MNKVLMFLKKKKFLSFLILAILVLGGYFGYKKVNPPTEETIYNTSVATKGVLISSISGTGQVSSSNEVEVKSKVSGTVSSVSIAKGQVVEKNELLVSIDSRESANKVSEAVLSLENEQLELEDLLSPVDNLTLIQAQNDLADAKDTLTKLKTSQADEYQNAIDDKTEAEDDLEKTYEDAYNTVANAFLDLPDIMTGLYSVLYSEEISEREITVNRNKNTHVYINSVSGYDDKEKFREYLEKAEGQYDLAKEFYDQSFDNYKDTSRYDTEDVIEELLDNTYETVKKIADAVKSQSNMLDWWVEYWTDRDYQVYQDITIYQNSLATFTSQTNNHLSSLLSGENSINNYKKIIKNSIQEINEMEQNQPLELAQAERDILEKEEKVKDLEEGATDLEIRSQELSIQQKKNDLLEAQQDYTDHFVRAPFAGTIAEVDVVNGDEASGSTVVATLVTDQKIANITLNEIDASQVKVGQKVNLEFDAIDDLTIVGEVVEVDVVGQVSSGVVSYDIKIGFDLQDERIKSGMSVSADIILESKVNVLLAPIGAVKTQGENSYLSILVGGILQKKEVVTGISNDTMIEIISGIEEGDEIITNTITNGSAQNKNTQSSAGGQQDDAMRNMMRMTR